jgi:two-component sensor histidine kinase
MLRHEHKVALGLIASELVAYALEREPCDEGTIEVSLEAAENRHAQLMVRDIRTLPDARPPRVPGEFELMLTRLLATQLGGKICFRHNATQVTFTFPLAMPG